jgi:ADP-ribose pyrophosphatase YjhB (NUDIX family)
LKPFRFCPSCAARLERPDYEGALRCPRCGRTWYRNPAPTVGCVIVRAGRALVTVRAGEPHKGRIDVPGGFLALGEDPVQGLKREVAEELGVEVEATDDDFVQCVAHRYDEDGEWLVSMGYRARLVRGDPRPSDDVAAIQWVSPEKVGDLDFAWPHDRELVTKVLASG